MCGNNMIYINLGIDEMIEHKKTKSLTLGFVAYRLMTLNVVCFPWDDRTVIKYIPGG